MRKGALPVVDGRAPGHIDRRHALKVLAIAAAAPTLTACLPSDGTGEAGASAAAAARGPGPAGTAWDPDLLSPVVPWDPVLTEPELESLTALCDVIIPADERSPAASELGAHDFIDEWVSAPYERNQRDQVTVRGGLIWIDREAAARFGEGLRFGDLGSAQQRAICDDICSREGVAPELEAAARFFDRVRDLTAAAFWTTPQGMADLQYVGNVPLARWDPPPPEVLRHLGLA